MSLQQWEHDPLRPKGEVIPKEVLALREQLANMNWVTCPRCGYRWQYRGKGKAMKCNKCKWCVNEKENKAVYDKKRSQENRQMYLAYAKKQYQNHKEARLVYQQKYYHNHKEERLVYQKKHYQDKTRSLNIKQPKEKV